MYLYYNTLIEKKQPFFVRKFKILILFSCFRYKSLIFAQENMSIFVNFLVPLVVDKISHTIYRSKDYLSLYQYQIKSFIIIEKLPEKGSCVSKSVSRVLSWTVIYLGRALPLRLGATSTGQPSRLSVPPRCCFGQGLHGGEVSLTPVSSYLTFPPSHPPI